MMKDVHRIYMSHDGTLVIVKLKFVPGTISAVTVPRQNTLQIAYSFARVSLVTPHGIESLEML